MQHTQLKHPRLRLLDTPQMRAYLNATHARLLDTLHSTEASPVEKTAAWAQYRTERFTETGLEGMTGPDATYHLGNDFGGAIDGMARKLSHSNKKDAKAATESVLWAMHRVMGFRWCSGVGGLLSTLESQGAPRERCTVFLAERDAFDHRRADLSRAVRTLLDEGLTVPALAAARCLVVALIQEAEQLAEWLEVAGKWGEAQELRTYADDAGAELAGEDG